MGSQRAEELAGALEAATGELLATLERLPADAWTAPCTRERATVAVVVGGLADGMAAEVAALKTIAAAGQPPVRSRADLERDAAARAAVHAGATPEQLIGTVRANAAAAVDWVRGLDGGGLDWTGSYVEDLPAWNVDGWIDRLVVRVRDHVAVVRAAAGEPVAEPTVSLREVTLANLYELLDMKLKPGQEHFCATNAKSICEGHYQPNAWFRAIHADETPVGFVMLADDAEEQKYYLWRLMLDAAYQRRGYGRRALALVVEYVRTRPGARELLTSYYPGAPGHPGPFYRGLGFEETGEVDEEGEVGLRLRL